METAEREKYQSCEYLEYGLVAFTEGIRHCCGDISVDCNTLPVMPYDDTFYNHTNEFLEKLIQDKKNIIEANRRGEKTICQGCQYLKEQYWDKEKKITQLNFSLDSSCNLKCSYCYKMQNNYAAGKAVDVNEIIKKILESNQVIVKSQVIYASGEISIQPDVDKIVESLKDYDVAFLTNATIYNSKIHEIIKKESSSIVVSLDSGTRETYRKVKGVDLFEKVCENIGKYAEDGGHIILKYILMENNCEKADLDGFIDICKKCNTKSIRVARNWYEPQIAEKVKAASIHLMIKARRNHIVVHNDGTTIADR